MCCKWLILMNKFTWSDEPGQTAMPIAKAGYPFIFAAAFATAVFSLLELIFPAVAGLAVTFFICYFFRDPDRVVPTGDNVVVSPADGKVVSVETVSSSPLHEEPCMKISVFMSVFNVHVNRIPHEGVIKNIDYYPGKFFSANLDKSSDQNERNALLIETPQGSSICFVQIAGLIARRIICRIQPGDRVKRGQRFGMICFGSRLDVYLPVNAALRVAKGDKVQAGTTILGELE